jgi:phospholipase/carboxylesterase
MADLPLEHVSRPPDDPPDGPSPGVVVLHGRGADEHDLLPVAAALPEDLHVLSARAPDPLGPGYTWYELDLSGGGLHASQPDAEQFRRSLDLVHEFVAAAVDAYDLAPDGIGLLGFSQGAITSLATLVERRGSDAPPSSRAQCARENPDHPWVVALNGYLPESHDDPDDVAGAAGTPVFVGAGERDQVIPPERAERAATALADAGLPVSFETYPVGHGTTPDEIGDVADWVQNNR